jgi:HPt (histidine-containing phosphotransfer) domain-containing protein
MAANTRKIALQFLVDVQMLTLPEAEQALAVASGVLRSGLDRLAACVAANDGPGCVEAAHGLKGNLLNLGLPELAQTVQHACSAARNGDTVAAKTVRRSLARVLAPILTPRSDENGPVR